MAGEPSPLLCNGCGNHMAPQTQGVAASCYHMFCCDCAKKIVDNDEACPLCQGVIAKGDIRLVTVLQPSNKLKLMLCGQTPDAVADAALFAINFYVEQQRLTGMYDNQRLKSKMAQMQSQCKKKLVEMQNAFQQAKQKCVQALQQRNALEQDNQELQQKYAQKAGQARKLQEMFKQLQQENEELKRMLGMRGGGAGGSGAGRSGMGALAPRSAGSGRQPSPFNGATTQMVTTVHQTKAMFDLSSPASASGLHLLTGHGSAVAGSGNNLFGTAGHGMAAGPRPSTAGGMFSAAALGNARGASGGGGGNGLRLQGNVNVFGSPAGGFTM